MQGKYRQHEQITGKEFFRNLGFDGGLGRREPTDDEDNTDPISSGYERIRGDTTTDPSFPDKKRKIAGDGATPN